MTRINLIPPSLLLDQHLMAEYRELPMVVSSLRRTLSSKKGLDRTKLVKPYSLSGGHVYGFYNYGRFLHKRYQSLIQELTNRKFQIKPEERQRINWNLFHDNGLFNDRVFTVEEVKVNVDRIVSRYLNKPDWYRLNHKPVPQAYAKVILEVESYHR